jgi:hypothetical protein
MNPAKAGCTGATNLNAAREMLFFLEERVGERMCLAMACGHRGVANEPGSDHEPTLHRRPGDKCPGRACYRYTSSGRDTRSEVEYDL